MSILWQHHPSGPLRSVPWFLVAAFIEPLKNCFYLPLKILLLATLLIFKIEISSIFPPSKLKTSDIWDKIRPHVLSSPFWERPKWFIWKIIFMLGAQSTVVLAFSPPLLFLQETHNLLSFTEWVPKPNQPAFGSLAFRSTSQEFSIFSVN